MSQTIMLDIIDDKVLNLLVDLERLNLIRLHKESNRPTEDSNIHKYKGAIKKQPLYEVDKQLNELRSGWE
ncbi:hypothetical protein DSL64_26110 [Dyadobacter luteus]|uniref:Uncharacterized protein n=1 Tax=Dyadobacter luteus TaxID=2259619 RepID=A0A3D8Y4L6_9BACT|nr:hypothetical protein [Dyadobacter luteus]REA56714.1 hypothetical protein DSL64_26110 [Dyadobacter luteus]